MHTDYPPKRGPVPIREVVLKLSHHLGEGTLKQEKTTSLWKRLIGKKKSHYTKVSTFENGLLTILVDNASSFYELSLEKELILQKLQRELGKDQVRDIQFRVGTVSSSNHKTSPNVS